VISASLERRRGLVIPETIGVGDHCKAYRGTRSLRSFGRNQSAAWVVGGGVLPAGVGARSQVGVLDWPDLAGGVTLARQGSRVPSPVIC